MVPRFIAVAEPTPSPSESSRTLGVATRCRYVPGASFQFRAPFVLRRRLAPLLVRSPAEEALGPAACSPANARLKAQTAWTPASGPISVEIPVAKASTDVTYFQWLAKGVGAPRAVDYGSSRALDRASGSQP